MPASQRSLRVTEAYRRRLFAIRDRTERFAASTWPTIEELDRTNWPDRMAAALTQAQTEAVRVSAGYLTAFLSSELGRRTAGPTLSSGDYAGLSRDGRPLSESLRSPLIGTLAALKEGKSDGEALRIGLDRTRRMVEMDLMAAARNSAADGRRVDPRFKDQAQRVVEGTCEACMALSGEAHEEIHPNCECVFQPVVIGVRDLIPVPTGKELFDRLSKSEQDQKFGPDVAGAIREDEVPIHRLVQHNRLATDQPDFITTRPAQDVTN